MIMIAGDRGSGRTCALAALVLEDPSSFLVVANSQLARDIGDRYPALLKGGKRIMSISQAVGGAYRGFSWGRRCYIDDKADMPPDQVRKLEDNCKVVGYSVRT